MKKLVFSVVALLAVMDISAQRLDFNMTGRRAGEVNEQEWTSWQVKNTGETISVGNLKIKVQAAGEATNLSSQWNKPDLKQKGLLLTGDGLTSYVADKSGNLPVQTDKKLGITLVISGLSKGEHTIQAWHNGVNGYKNLSPIDIYVDGNLVKSNVRQSANATTEQLSATSYITINATEGKDVVISYITNPQKGQTYDCSHIYLNALMVDMPNTRMQASAPMPANKDYHMDADNGSAVLSWTSPDGSAKHHIYIGTDENNMQLAGVTTDSKYELKNVSNLKTYYWRIDEEVDGKTTKGNVWSFRPRHLAFPGAEGYGKYAIGGRGGSVYHVTTLDDNGDDQNPIEGSLRYGIKKVKGPRTIVFDIGGVINLKSRLSCADPYVTIAGQTAPGQGIMLRTSPFGMASDGITRFIRMRLGHKRLVDGVIPGTRNGKSYGADAGKYDETTLSGLDGMGMAGNNNSIMDHCSIAWTIDEAFSSRSAQGITLQRTLISEALNEAGHPNYKAGTHHGYAGTIGGGEMAKTTTAGSYHHNLLAHCDGRNWSMSGGLDGSGYYDGHHDIFNNVVYNWGKRATDGGSHEVNFVNNFYKMGPATHQKFLMRLQLEGTGRGSQSVYSNGNIRQELNGTLVNDKEGETYRYELSGGQKLSWQPLVNQPFFPSLANIQDARAAYKDVLSDVGANQPALDIHDQRMIRETLNGTYSVTGSRSGKKGLPDSELDKGCEGFEGLQFATVRRDASWDADGDGMADWWEKAMGIDDPNADANGDGYTNLEDYLNWMAEPHVIGEQKIDLRQFFAGYTNDPVFTIVGMTGNVKATVKGHNLKVKNLKGIASVTIRATDKDGWGKTERKIGLFL
jgi:hypothetical protein